MPASSAPLRGPPHTHGTRHTTCTEPEMRATALWWVMPTHPTPLAPVEAQSLGREDPCGEETAGQQPPESPGARDCASYIATPPMRPVQRHPRAYHQTQGHKRGASFQEGDSRSHSWWILGSISSRERRRTQKGYERRKTNAGNLESGCVQEERLEDDNSETQGDTGSPAPRTNTKVRNEANNCNQASTSVKVLE
ncbi:hypothetical protein CB1_000404002 [Camelus ferus]|nr:hypothetical protein CB1_000404002 [Camelus ferus]